MIDELPDLVRDGEPSEKVWASIGEIEETFQAVYQKMIDDQMAPEAEEARNERGN
jgi:hypothetical protein